MTSFDPSITSYYERAPEETRLESEPFQLEGIRTRELIERFAPSPPATVLDVGGAGGVYARWLAAKGYRVHLLDRSPRLVRAARRGGGIDSCLVGDARTLPYPSRCANMVLLLGPLYHLTEAADRVVALREAARVLVPGGLLIAATISRWASILDGVARDLFVDPRFASIVERDLDEGQHRNETERLDYFTTAYLHHPRDLRAEIEAAGLALVGQFGIEGPGWLLPDLGERMADPRRREDLLRLARAVESEEAMVGVSAHHLAVAKAV